MPCAGIFLSLYNILSGDTSAFSSIARIFLKHWLQKRDITLHRALCRHYPIPKAARDVPQKRHRHSVGQASGSESCILRALRANAPRSSFISEAKGIGSLRRPFMRYYVNNSLINSVKSVTIFTLSVSSPFAIIRSLFAAVGVKAINSAPKFSAQR